MGVHAQQLEFVSSIDNALILKLLGQILHQMLLLGDGCHLLLVETRLEERKLDGSIGLHLNSGDLQLLVVGSPGNQNILSVYVELVEVLALVQSRRKGGVPQQEVLELTLAFFFGVVGQQPVEVLPVQRQLVRLLHRLYQVLAVLELLLPERTDELLLVGVVYGEMLQQLLAVGLDLGVLVPHHNVDEGRTHYSLLELCWLAVLQRGGAQVAYLGFIGKFLQ